MTVKDLVMKAVVSCGVLAFALVAGGASAKPAAKSAAPDPALVAAGAKVFETNCQVCHQAGGVGVSGAFPRLAGRVPVIAASPDGRKFLAKLVLNGMSGSVTVDGQRIMGVMPGFGQFSDADAAAALTYVSTLDAGKKPPKAFTPADIAAARTAKVSPSDMATERNGLAGRKLIP